MHNWKGEKPLANRLDELLESIGLSFLEVELKKLRMKFFSVILLIFYRLFENIL